MAVPGTPVLSSRHCRVPGPWQIGSWLLQSSGITWHPCSVGLFYHDCCPPPDTSPLSVPGSCHFCLEATLPVRKLPCVHACAHTHTHTLCCERRATLGGNPPPLSWCVQEEHGYTYYLSLPPSLWDLVVVFFNSYSHCFCALFLR